MVSLSHGEIVWCVTVGREVTPGNLLCSVAGTSFRARNNSKRRRLLGLTVGGNWCPSDYRMETIENLRRPEVPPRKWSWFHLLREGPFGDGLADCVSCQLLAEPTDDVCCDVPHRSIDQN